MRRASFTFWQRPEGEYELLWATLGTLILRPDSRRPLWSDDALVQLMGMGAEVMVNRSSYGPLRYPWRLEQLVKELALNAK